MRKLRKPSLKRLQGLLSGYEAELQGAGNITMLVDFSIKPVFGADGKVLLLIAEGRDITARKHAEEALRESEERFRRIFEDGPLGMAIVGSDFRFISVNRMLCEITGYTDQELLTRSFADITHPEDLDHDMTEVRKLYAG